MTYKLLILEDDPFARLSISSATTNLGLAPIIVESSPNIALDKAAKVMPDAAILDLHLGSGATGLDVAVALRKLNPEIGIVLLTSYEDPRLLNPSLPKPPSGTVYLVKKDIENLKELGEAVELSVSQGVTKSDSKNTTAFGKMTDSQIETLRLIANGLSNSEIAKQRFITEKSVELTITRLSKKLGIAGSPDYNQRVRIARIYFRSIGLKYDEE